MWFGSEATNKNKAKESKFKSRLREDVVRYAQDEQREIQEELDGLSIRYRKD